MDISDPYVRQAFYVNLDTKFNEALKGTTSWADKIATKVPSTSRSTRHMWLTQLGPLVEYLGEKPVEAISAKSYVIENKKYGKAVEIPEEDLDDDQIGLWGQVASMIGAQAAKWPDDMIVNLIQNGKTITSTDGQPFFNASHPVDVDNSGAGTFSNLLTSKPLTSDNFADVWRRMTQIKMSNGRFLPIQPVMTIVDPTNTIALKQILNGAITAVSVAAGSGVGGAVGLTNVLQGATEALTIPELGNEPGVWYMIGRLFGLSPFLYQVRKEPTTIPLTDGATANRAWHDKLVWITKARGNAGFTFPYLAIRCEPS